MVELHGSKLEVSSIPSQGSVFTFALELAEPSLVEETIAVPLVYAETAVSSYLPAAELTAVKPPNVLNRTDRPRILAIDDDAINLSILSSLLSSDNYDVVTASSGKEALSILDTQVLDLIISDVMMPQMSGYELTRTIRERFSISELPILLLTARSRSEDIQAGFQSGANDYVMKPVEAAELKSRVKALTELKASIRARLRIEAAWLQAQIQPHFLFNTLNSIAALSEFDTTRMRLLLEAFGNYLRTSFQFANTEKLLVPLNHELDLDRSYLFIESERFEERLNVIWEVDPNIQIDVPPLSIQPLVENAVRHGITKRSRGGTVQILIMDHEEYIVITIADDGVGIKEEKLWTLLDQQSPSSRGIGLLNTERRLKQLYGCGLQIDSSPDVGTKVSFRAMK
ncbi:response regulator [Paenibacillus foliorum]|uniref:response regulator n=1 Tax=Paenibacillus foliorum TaxID=2654974 RepID=UPI001491F440|nr:response regulator [Paenibacillus foliorum]